MQNLSYLIKLRLGIRITEVLRFFGLFFYKLTDFLEFRPKILVNYVYTQFTKILDRNFNSRLIVAFSVKKSAKKWIIGSEL